jgi:hypothetical protein
MAKILNGGVTSGGINMGKSTRKRENTVEE